MIEPPGFFPAEEMAGMSRLQVARAGDADAVDVCSIFSSLRSTVLRMRHQRS